MTHVIEAGEVLGERGPLRLRAGSRRSQRADGVVDGQRILIREWTGGADLGLVFPPWELEQPETVAQGSVPGLEPVSSWDGPHRRWLQPWVEGWSLRRWLRAAGRLPLPVACAVVESVCRILDAMHGARTDAGHALGRLHRRVDPSAVLLTERGLVQLAHPVFASLQSMAAATGVTRPEAGAVAGMSPEQVRGVPIDVRSDVYQANALLFTLLTGRPPFVGADALAVCKAILAGRRRPASDFAPGISPTLDALLESGLARQPSARPASAAVMADRLAELRTAEGVTGVWASVTEACRYLGSPTPLGW